jgi:hypothetical protein
MRSSKVWKYFKRPVDKTDEKAKCLLCGDKLACRAQSTTGLWTHLRTKHKKEHDSLNAPEQEKA